MGVASARGADQTCRPWRAPLKNSLLLLLALASACGREPDTFAPNAPTGFNVVLLTVDGVRWQELFEGTDPLLTEEPGPLFPTFWSQVAPRGKVYGDRTRGEAMHVVTAANASLPGYVSIYAEVDQGCLTNFCARVTVPTFLDRLHDELGLPPAALQVVAAWPKLELAVTGRDDVAVVRAGRLALGEADVLRDRPAPRGAFDADRPAVSAGLRALDAHPRFLHLSLVDSDRFGHHADYPRYARALQAYDQLVGELLRRLDEGGEWGRDTALIVTTDHGRGLWDQWSEHGPQAPSSAQVWAFVKLPAEASGWVLVDPGARTFDHHDVRYTIEALFGLGTKSSSGFSTGFVKRVDPRR